MLFDQIEESRDPEDEAQGKFHYYYNREERLSKAPQIVQEFYENGGKFQKKGFFKFMFEKKSTRFLFLSLVVVCAFSFGIRFLQTNVQHKIAGTSVQFSAISIDETVYPRVKFEALRDKSKALNDGAAVQVVFKAYESSGIICDEKTVSDIFTGDELFVGTRFSDYDIISVSAEIKSGDEEKVLFAKVVRQ